MLPDSTETLISQLRLITGGIFALGMITLLLSVIAFRKSRNETFWRLRRDAGRRGTRYIAASVILLGISAAFCMVTATVTYVEDRDSSEAAADITETPLGTETEETESSSSTADPTIATAEDTPPTIIGTTPLPTLPSLNDPTPDAIADAALSAASNPTEEQPQAENEDEAAVEETATAEPTIEVAEVQPTIDAIMTIVALDDVIGDDLRAIQPTTSFSTDTQRLFVFFDYENMAAGMQWGQILRKDGEIIQQRNQQWGIAGSSGETFFFFGNGEGFDAGVYEIQLTATNPDGIEFLLASTSFTIVPED